MRLVRVRADGIHSCLVGRAAQGWVVVLQGFDGRDGVEFFERDEGVSDPVDHGAEPAVSIGFGWLGGIEQVFACLRRVRAVSGFVEAAEASPFAAVRGVVETDLRANGGLLVVPRVPSKAFVDPARFAVVIVRTCMLCAVSGSASSRQSIANAESEAFCAEDPHAGDFHRFGEGSYLHDVSARIIASLGVEDRPGEQVLDAGGPAWVVPPSSVPESIEVNRDGADMVSSIVAGGQALHAYPISEPAMVSVESEEVGLVFYSAIVSPSRVDASRNRFELFVRGLGPRLLPIADAAARG